MQRSSLSRYMWLCVASSDHTADPKAAANVAFGLNQTLNLSEAAQNHMQKCILKNKRLRASEALRGFCDSKIELPEDTSTANVTARLYNAQVVKETTTDFLDGLRVALGVDRPPLKKPRKRVEEPRHRSLHESHPNDEPKNMSDSGNHDAHGLDEGDQNDSNNLPDGQVVPSSEPISAGTERVTKKMKKRVVRNLRGSPTYSPYARSVSPTTSQAAAWGENQLAEKPTGRAFLPALTMGGYWSGSESGKDQDDLVDTNIAPRRNRRGQRARQQIWEKKYGRGARHLQGQNGQPNGKGQNKVNGGARDNRDAGWDVQRGAQDGDSKHSRYKPGRAGARPTTAGQRTGGVRPAGGTDVQVEKSAGHDSSMKDGGHLHPSWEAARKAKERRKAGSTETFAGSKIVFD